MCLISTPFALQEPKKQIARLLGRASAADFVELAVHRRAAFFYGRGRSLAGGAGAIRLWNGGGQVANMTRFTLIIRARRASPSLPVRSHIRQNCLPIHCQRDIRERAIRKLDRGRGGERNKAAVVVRPSVRSRPSVRPTVPRRPPPPSPFCAARS